MAGVEEIAAIMSMLTSVVASRKQHIAKNTEHHKRLVELTDARGQLAQRMQEVQEHQMQMQTQAARVALLDHLRGRGGFVVPEMSWLRCGSERRLERWSGGERKSVGSAIGDSRVRVGRSKVGPSLGLDRTARAGIAWQEVARDKVR